MLCWKALENGRRSGSCSVVGRVLAVCVVMLRLPGELSVTECSSFCVWKWLAIEVWKCGSNSTGGCTRHSLQLKWEGEVKLGRVQNQRLTHGAAQARHDVEEEICAEETSTIVILSYYQSNACCKSHVYFQVYIYKVCTKVPSYDSVKTYTKSVSPNIRAVPGLGRCRQRR